MFNSPTNQVSKNLKLKYYFSIIKLRSKKVCIKAFYCFVLFFYLFLAVLGLRCCAQAFSSCSEQGLLFIAVRGLLIAVASLVAEHEL